MSNLISLQFDLNQAKFQSMDTRRLLIEAKATALGLEQELLQGEQNIMNLETLIAQDKMMEEAEFLGSLPVMGDT